MPREESIATFLRAYESLGYAQCDNTELEAGFTKVALYANGQEPTHAARQLPDGTWTSKLGPLEDISHTLDGLVGNEYGSVVAVLKRPLPMK